MPGGPQGGNATDIFLFSHGGDMQENLPVEDTNTNNSSVPQISVYTGLFLIH
jgi:hypothetical protein